MSEIIETPSLPAVVTKREQLVTADAIPVLDTARFEHMQRIAVSMARSSLVPESLRTVGPKDSKEDLPFETVVANCFRIVNFSVRAGIDPFAALDCCSLVHGRLCLEGKLVAAVIQAKLGIDLEYEWDDKEGDKLGIVVSGKMHDGRVKTIKGTVGEWKTAGNNSPWPKQARKQLAYRGAREWARLHAPAILLGVYTPDELEALSENARAVRAVPVSQIAARFAAPSQATGGFSLPRVEAETEATAEPEPEVAAPAAEDTEGASVEEAPAEPAQPLEPTADNYADHVRVTALDATDGPALVAWFRSKEERALRARLGISIDDTKPLAELVEQRAAMLSDDQPADPATHERHGRAA